MPTAHDAPRRPGFALPRHATPRLLPIALAGALLAPLLAYPSTAQALPEAGSFTDIRGVERWGGNDGSQTNLTRPIPGSATGLAFAAPLRPWGAGHRGLDFAARTGESVTSPVLGRVRFAGQVAGRGVLTIEPASARTMRVTLEPVVSTVVVGQSVSPGTPIGTVGSGGHCHRRCLHLGVRDGTGYLDPWPMLADRGPVLKPP